MSVWFFVFYAMQSLAPGRDHAEAATAVTRAVLADEPLFRGDTDRLKTAALMVSVAFRESSLRNDAVGDHGRARCLFQLWDAPRDVSTDPELCARIAMGRLRESMRACGPENLLGIYASGPGGCTNRTAKRISADRMWMARKLAKEVRP